MELTPGARSDPATPTAGSGDPAATGDDAAAAPATPHPGLSPGVVRALQGIPLMIADLGGLQLFRDEQLEAAQVIAAWATGARGVRVQGDRRPHEAQQSQTRTCT